MTMPRRKEYETLYILVPNLGEDEQKASIDAVAEFIRKTGAEIIKNDVWGRRRLAYPIKKHQEGVYVLVRCKADPSMPKELEDYVKRTPHVLRQLTTLVTKHQLNEEARLRKIEANRAEEAAKREARAAEEAAAAEAQAAAQETAVSSEDMAEESSAPSDSDDAEFVVEKDEDLEEPDFDEEDKAENDDDKSQ